MPKPTRIGHLVINAKDLDAATKFYTDVIGFADAELPRAVATCGTALTEEHIKLLKRFSANRLVLSFDADAAGHAAAERVYAWEKEYGLDVRVADLPPGEDPADLAREDPKELRRAVEEAVSFMRFRLQRVLDAGHLTSVEGRARSAEAGLVVVARLRPLLLVPLQLPSVAALGVGAAAAPGPTRIHARKWYQFL